MQAEQSREVHESLSHTVNQQLCVLEVAETHFQPESLHVCRDISSQLPLILWKHFILVPHKAYKLHIKQATVPWENRYYC